MKNIGNTTYCTCRSPRREALHECQTLGRARQLDDAHALSLAGDVARLANTERERAASALPCCRLGYGWFPSKCDVECLVFTATGEPQSVADHGVNELGLVLLRLAERGFLDHRLGTGIAP